MTEQLGVSRKKILFVTAFKELGRERWAYWARRTDEYFVSFKNIVECLKHDLIVFIEDDLRDRVQAIVDAAAAADRVTVMDYRSVNSFLVKYLDHERAVMAAPAFRQLVAHRRDCPETYIPEYTLVNHSKINFLSAAQTARPDYDFYAWTDFGGCRMEGDIMLIIPQLDVDKIPDRIMYNAFAQPPSERPDETTLLRSGNVHMTGGGFIVPASRVKQFERAWELKLIDWQVRGIADDDQALVLQLFYDAPGDFLLICSGAQNMLYILLPKILDRLQPLNP